jgi:hypothetical protein
MGSARPRSPRRLQRLQSLRTCNRNAARSRVMQRVKSKKSKCGWAIDESDVSGGSLPSFQDHFVRTPSNGTLSSHLCPWLLTFLTGDALIVCILSFESLHDGL